MTTKDTIHTIDIALTNQDSLFVPQYIYKNPLTINLTGGENISFRNYLFATIKESEFKQQISPTLFKEKTSYSKDLQMQQHSVSQSTDWIFVALVVITFLIALLVRFAKNSLLPLLQGCFSSSQIGISTKNGTTIQPISFIPILIIFLPLVSFLILCTINYFSIIPNLRGHSLWIDEITKNSFLLWIAIYVCCIVVYHIKILFIKFFSWVFAAKRISNYYVQILLNFSVLGSFLIFLPTVFSIYTPSFYQDIFLIISSLLLVLLYVTRLLRCFFFFFYTFKFSHIYLFFYLFTLEFLPLVVITKVLFF